MLDLVNFFSHGRALLLFIKTGLFFLCYLFTYPVRQHEVFLLFLALSKVCDLFPDLNILIGSFGVFLRVIRHELQVLITSVALKSREDTHWYIVCHIFEQLLPPINCGFKCEDLWHALIDTELAQGNCSPYGLERCLLLIKIIDIVLEACDFFLFFLDISLNGFNTINWFLQALQVIYLPLDPIDYLSVRVAQLVRQPIHHLVIFMVWIWQYALLFVRVRVKVDACVLVLGQLLEKMLYTQRRERYHTGISWGRFSLQ